MKFRNIISECLVPLFYRAQQPQGDPAPRKAPPRALSSEERAKVLGVLHSERFVDTSPAETWATLLDEGTYLCSVRSMYRILEAHHEVRERRNQLRHPNYKKPELLATAPKSVPGETKLTKLAYSLFSSRSSANSPRL